MQSSTHYAVYVAVCITLLLLVVVGAAALLSSSFVYT